MGKRALNACHPAYPPVDAHCCGTPAMRPAAPRRVSLTCHAPHHPASMPTLPATAAAPPASPLPASRPPPPLSPQDYLRVWRGGGPRHGRDRPRGAHGAAVRAHNGAAVRAAWRQRRPTAPLRLLLLPQRWRRHGVTLWAPAHTPSSPLLRFPLARQQAAAAAAAAAAMQRMRVWCRPISSLASTPP